MSSIGSVGGRQRCTMYARTVQSIPPEKRIATRAIEGEAGSGMLSTLLRTEVVRCSRKRAASAFSGDERSVSSLGMSLRIRETDS